MQPSSDQEILRSDLLPKVSIRSLFVVTLAAAILAAIARSADSGETAANAFLLAVGSLITFFALSSLLFFVASVFDIGRRKEVTTDDTSSNVDQSLPPQILQPRDRSV
ncbi:MAG: hypothetical protein L7U72_12185 [Rubripirellula sp.]|nr:hypothetical protein [Rubripirellula sp.]